MIRYQRTEVRNRTASVLLSLSSRREPFALYKTRSVRLRSQTARELPAPPTYSSYTDWILDTSSASSVVNS